MTEAKGSGVGEGQASAQAGAAKAGTAKTGTAKTGTAKTGNATAATAKADRGVDKMPDRASDAAPGSNQAGTEQNRAGVGVAGAKTSIIDAFDFARTGKEASGSVALARLRRATEGLPPQPVDEVGLVHWQVRGRIGNTTDGAVTAGAGIHHGAPMLDLHVQARPVLICQRCLTPFAYPIDSSVSLHLVKTEAELDDDLSLPVGDAVGEDEAWDADADAALPESAGRGLADGPEKVLGSHRFDVLSQVEDELILSIPYVPKHVVCPGAPAKTEAGDAGPDKRPSPFAVLEKLKQTKV